MSWAVWTAIGAAVILAAVLLHLRRAARRRDVLIRRLRTSAMYEEIHSLLSGLETDILETLILDRNGITLKLLDGRSMTYDYRAHRVDPLSDDTLLVMAQSVLYDLPSLQNERYYTCLTPRRRDPEPRYIYTMRHNRKDYLLRSMRGQV